MNEGRSAIRFREVSAGYRGRQVLRGVTFDIPTGRIVGVSGPNGCGKTTLLHAIHGMLDITSGEARVCGLELTPANYRAIQRQTACVFQMPNVDRGIPVSAGDVVMMGRYARLKLLRRPGRDDREIVRDSLEMVGASHLAGRPYGQLSGGEQQRVNLARALAQKPRLLLLDEPTTFLDAESQERISQVIREVHAAGGLTTIIVSHDARVLAELCQETLTMDRGRIEGIVTDMEPTCA